MSFEPGTNWYAIYTKPNQEDIVAYHLSRLELEVLNPKQKREKIVWGQVKVAVRPLFPCYLFAKFSPAKYLHTIRYTRGVRKVLQFGGTLLSVDEAIIQSIQRRLNPDGFVELQRTSLATGDCVSVDGGPFSGLHGIFSSAMNDSNRVVVLLDMLGYSVQVVMDKNVLKAVQ